MPHQNDRAICTSRHLSIENLCDALAVLCRRKQRTGKPNRIEQGRVRLDRLAQRAVGSSVHKMRHCHAHVANARRPQLFERLVDSKDALPAAGELRTDLGTRICLANDRFVFRAI